MIKKTHNLDITPQLSIDISKEFYITRIDLARTVRLKKDEKLSYLHP